MNVDYSPDAAFSSNMKSRRELLGWNQARLLKELHALGFDNFHQTTLSRIENATQAPRLGEAVAIAEALGLKVSELLVPDDKFDAFLNFITEVDTAARDFDSALAALIRFEMSQAHLSRLMEDPSELLKLVSEDPRFSSVDTERLMREKIAEAQALINANVIQEYENTKQGIQIEPTDGS